VKKITSYFLLFLIVLLFCIQCQKNETPEPTPDTDSRAPAIEFSLVGIDGANYTLSAQKGKVVLVDFWATWCPPCIEEIPHLVELHKEYNEKGLVVWGVGLDNEAKLRAFADEKGVVYPILVGNETVGQDYGVQGIPTTLLFDKKNRIAFKHVGFSQGMEEQLKKEIEQLLKE
jgi:thiol-disulfide isomerase/thioredoxin